MFIMAKGGCLLLILEGGGRRCSTTNRSRLLEDCKKSSGAGCKTCTSGTWEMMLCSGDTQHTAGLLPLSGIRHKMHRSR